MAPTVPDTKEEAPLGALLFAPTMVPGVLWCEALAYQVDAFQRTILFLDVLRRRGNAFFEMEAQTAPSVMSFKTELVFDGRDLPRPVNYLLLHVLPPPGTEIDASKRPLIVFDPRAGQGPGIGGMKEDSEVGIALANGHPVYFVSFLVRPEPGQTVLSVCEAMARFVQVVAARHAKADPPCLIGNCQAGWHLALMRALRPELSGVLILAASPLSYWSGRQGGSIARYAAGLMGGSWVNAFLSDCGAGLFDGAWLVLGFEANNPVRAYFHKPYDVYAKIDTEGPRFLQFERWWGSPVLLGAEEIRFIAEDLFIGNRLVKGSIKDAAGRRAALAAITSPIVVFCSRGDDITPPAQALGWIADVYGSDEGLVQSGRTIVYCLHESVGHLGIFVSSRVVAREYNKFIGALDMIEALPPGLYEAVFLLEEGEPVIRFERRTLEAIQIFGGTTHEDEARFETVARLSEVLARAYRALVSPFVKAAIDDRTAALLRAWHPVRVPFAFFSDRNPFLFAVAPVAEWIRAARRPVSQDNLFLFLQDNLAQSLATLWARGHHTKQALLEAGFFAFYGLPQIQAAFGVSAACGAGRPSDCQDKDLGHKLHDIENGGFPEAAIRSLLYALRGSSFVDERAYEAFAQQRDEGVFLPECPTPVCAGIMRRQQQLLVYNEAAAVAALPLLLQGVSFEEKRGILHAITTIVAADGPLSEEESVRLKRLEALFFEQGMEKNV